MSTTTERLPYTPAGDWGFSNSEAHFKSVVQFRDEAVADGWSIEGTYEPQETVERASRLKREGFVMQILTRDNRDASRPGKWGYEASIHIWAPDSLAVKAPQFYDFAEIKRRTRICSNCGADDIDTTRYSFAGRCCEACLPAMRKSHEQPGWCD